MPSRNVNVNKNLLFIAKSAVLAVDMVRYILRNPECLCILASHVVALPEEGEPGSE